MQFAVAIDPGETCGWAYAPLALGSREPDVTRAAPPMSGTPDELLEALAHSYGICVLLIEGFWLRHDAAPKLVGKEMLTSEVIGRVRQWAHTNSLPVVKLRPEVKGPIPAMLRHMRRDLPGKNEHERDAMCLLWAYWYRCRQEASS